MSARATNDSLSAAPLQTFHPVLEIDLAQWTVGPRVVTNGLAMIAHELDDDREIARRIRDGDESAFGALIDALHRPLLSVAEAYVGRGADAEDLVQQTWLSVADHIDSFEGRSSLRWWITRILVNAARTRVGRAKRVVSFDPNDEPAPAESRLSAVGVFTSFPVYASAPEEALLRKEASGWLVEALAALPPIQRTVVTLRDVEEWTAEEVCNALEISESNQRVILHRGRQRLRAALESRVLGMRKNPK